MFLDFLPEDLTSPLLPCARITSRDAAFRRTQVKWRFMKRSTRKNMKGPEDLEPSRSGCLAGAEVLQEKVHKEEKEEVNLEEREK